jgi:8-oxo-dGTP diphosphatase
MNNYVVGFLINNYSVALILKTHPDWQKGRLNGIGGSIKRGESPYQAMMREFNEEAGIVITDWHEFCLLKGNGYQVHCFSSKRSDSVTIKTMTDEMVSWYPINDLPNNIIPNLTWLIPMANYKYELKAEVIHNEPTC